MKHVAMIIALLGAALAVTAQEKATEVKPQKEHQALKQFEGDWDVRCKWMMPGSKREENTGTETSKIAFGGFWLVSDFKGEFEQQPFEGHSMTGWDPQSKKYMAVCVGSNGPNLMKFKGDADASGKKFTLTGDCIDPKTGKSVPHRMEWEITDKDHRSERIYITQDGLDTLVGEFFYTRKGKAEAK